MLRREETLYTNLCKLKQKVDFEECKNVIYSIPCKECEVSYTGETGQHFCQRVAQHESDIRNKTASNGFYAHIKKNKGHTIDWDQAVFRTKKSIGEGEK